MRDQLVGRPAACGMRRRPVWDDPLSLRLLLFDSHSFVCSGDGGSMEGGRENATWRLSRGDCGKRERRQSGKATKTRTPCVKHLNQTTTDKACAIHRKNIWQTTFFVNCHLLSQNGFIETLRTFYLIFDFVCILIIYCRREVFRDGQFWPSERVATTTHICIFCFCICFVRCVCC